MKRYRWNSGENNTDMNRIPHNAMAVRQVRKYDNGGKRLERILKIH